MKTLDTHKFIEAVQSGANSIANNEDRINAMNVFPVPDGDTGSNMSATALSAAETITQKKYTRIDEAAASFAKGMLLGARGNSGVILSQIFKGFSEGLKGKTVATSFDIVEAFNKAREFAYDSVMKPIEGTILTVIREIYEHLSKTVTPSDKIEKVFEDAVKYAKASVESTPKYLPVLREVGVNDSGGEGLYVILEGMLKSLKGEPIKKTITKNSSPTDFVIGGGENFNGEYGYCTEFIVELKNKNRFKKDVLIPKLEKIGNSIVVVQDDDILKVHLHTLIPGTALNIAQKYGEFMKIKSENMTLQANQSANIGKEKEEISSSEETKLKIGVVSCNTGAGIVSEMKEHGVDFIIQAGQTQNPSASDFFEAIEALNTDKVILLPNNSNIIMVAQQVASTSNKEIIVIPSKTQMEGIAAMINFDRDISLEENQEAMDEAITDVKTGQVTIASRTTKIEGVGVKKGEFLSISNRKIIGSNSSKTIAAINICKNIIDEDTEVVTIFYGEDATNVDANEIKDFVETHYDVDVEIKDGKQPIYAFLIAFE